MLLMRWIQVALKDSKNHPCEQESWDLIPLQTFSFEIDYVCSDVHRSVATCSVFIILAFSNQELKQASQHAQKSYLILVQPCALTRVRKNSIGSKNIGLYWLRGRKIAANELGNPSRTGPWEARRSECIVQNAFHTLMVKGRPKPMFLSVLKEEVQDFLPQWIWG